MKLVFPKWVTITISPQGGLIQCKQKGNLELQYGSRIFVYETQQFRERAAAMKVAEESSSEKEHKGNALASGADEGRDKLR